MSAAYIWIVFPIFLSLILGLLRKKRLIASGIGLSAAIILAGLAWYFPIGEPINLSFIPGINEFQINDTLFILGRKFLIENNFRPILILIYFGLAFWFGGALTTDADPFFIPIGLLIGALLTSVIAVEPFLYAALLIEITALISVIILTPPGSSKYRGTLRFIIFQTMGMILILISGWFLSSVEAYLGDINLTLRVTALVGLGFALLIAIFPFHSWMPILGEENPPYAAAFIFFIIPQATTLYLLSFVTRFTWVSTTPAIFIALRFMGLAMILVGGIWAALQNNLGRILAFAAITEIGFALLSLSILDPNFSETSNAITYNDSMLTIFFAQFLPKLISMAVWALGLGLIKSHTTDLEFHSNQGILFNMPFASISVILATFSIAGIPLLAEFPVRSALWSTVIQQSTFVGISIIIGLGGLLIAGFRTLALTINKANDSNTKFVETKSQIALMITGWILLFSLGIYPQLFNPFLKSITSIFIS